MGYRQAVEATHANYMMLEMSAAVKKDHRDEGARRLGGVADALEKENKSG